MRKKLNFSKHFISILFISSCFVVFGLFAFQAGEEFQVNIYTDGNQGYSRIAMDKKGNFVITWMSYKQDGSDFGIFAQRFDRYGLAIGPEFQVNTYTDGEQGGPEIAMDKKGNFVITWTSDGQDGSDYGIFAQRFDRYGLAIGPEFQVNTYTDGNQGCSRIAMDKKGNFVITWHSYWQDGSDYGIFAQRFNKRGKAIGSEFQVNTYTDGEQGGPEIAMDDKGNFVITWVNYVYYGIFAQRFNKQGKAIGSEFQVNTNPYGWHAVPAIAMDKKGNFVIAWCSYEQDGSSWEVFAQTFNKQGKAIGPEFQVNTYTDGDQLYHAVAMDKKGNFVITWTSDGQDGSSEGVFAQTFNKQGLAIGSEFQVNTYADDGQGLPAVAMDKKGNFVITWTSDGQDGSDTGIFAKMFKK